MPVSRTPSNPLPTSGAAPLASGAASYWAYSHSVESAWLEHGPFASWIVSAVRPSILAELGTHNGFSYFAFCEAVQRLGLNTKCYAVDTWVGDDHAGFYSEDVYTLVNRVNTENYASFSTLLRGYFDDHVNSFDDGTIDLLHIDGRHGYEDVKHDFESWLPKMSSRGVVMFHDIAVLDRGFGVWKFWEEISSSHPSFHFEHGYGLGVLAVGSEIPESLIPLVNASPEEADAVRAFYAERGALVKQTYQDGVDRHRDGIELAMARPALVDMAAELDHIKNSLAWKSTRPLRWVFGLIPLSVRRGIRPAPEEPATLPANDTRE